MSGRPIIVKIGGGAAIDIAAIAADLASLTEPVIVVHGANALRASLAAALSKPVKLLTSVSGQTSVHSDDDAIELMMLAYSGLQNKRIVEQLQMKGRNAIGLTGLDGRLITGRRNRGVRVREGERTLLVRDRSGKAAEVNAPLLTMLLSAGLTPVVTMPIADETGAAINSENDDVVAVMADAMQATAIVQLIEAPGLLRDPRDEHSLARRVSLPDLQAWEATAEGRFRRKLRALCRSVEADASRRVIVADGRVDRPVTRALAGEGTVISVA
jgi:[amino group carrier protein]-L-2-aminoadipate 6-kinase